MTVPALLVWALLVGLTLGPIFSAQKHDQETGWTWIVAALLLGPLAGVGYYMSRHAMRKVTALHAPKHAKPYVDELRLPAPDVSPAGDQVLNTRQNGCPAGSA